jgi:hypothetical protein
MLAITPPSANTSIRSQREAIELRLRPIALLREERILDDLQDPLGVVSYRRLDT